MRKEANLKIQVKNHDSKTKDGMEEIEVLLRNCFVHYIFHL